MTDVRGWEVLRDGKSYCLTDVRSRAELYGSTPGFTVTPLVAAPPAQTIAEVAEMGEAEAELAERLDDAWAGKGEYADGDVEILRALCGEALMAVRHLAPLACASPPEGAPTWEEVANALIDADEELRKAAAYYSQRGWWDNEHDARNARASVRLLLSRLPRQQEGSDR